MSGAPAFYGSEPAGIRDGDFPLDFFLFYIYLVHTNGRCSAGGRRTHFLPRVCMHPRDPIQGRNVAGDTVAPFRLSGGADGMNQIVQTENISRGFFTEPFIRFFRGLFLPLSRILKQAGVTPNAVTYVSFFFGLTAGVLLAMDRIYLGLAAGLIMGFADIVDGQLAKEFDGVTVFGGVLDSTIDRYNEFLIFAGFAWRYASLGRDLWIIPCVLAFFGSFMISYVKSRAESAGFECKVGRLQRPERLTLIAVGVLFGSVGIDVVVAFLAVATQATVLARLLHVWRKSRRK